MSLQIDSIAAGGDGVGRTNGLVVFVPRTAPGDVVTAVVSSKKHFARGSMRTIVKPSPDRIDPPCQHYTRDHCGGCQIQHISYAGQLASKRTIVKDALQRIGKREVTELNVERSPLEWRYRTRLTLAIRNRSGHWLAGLHKYDDPSRIFPLADCPITDKQVVSVWRDVMGASQYFPHAPELRGSVRLDNEGCSFVLTGGTRWSEYEQFIKAVPSISSMWWERDIGSGATERKLFYDRRKERTPAASFAQVNPTMASELRQYVLDKVSAHNPATVIDAYSGTGEIAITIAQNGARVIAIELDREASEWCASKLPDGSEAINDQVENALFGVLPADVVIINPPRAGVDENVVIALQENPPRVLIYVSCNPATLARDLSRMPEFEIASIRSFDMFPQTAHVETVCELIPRMNSL